MDGPDAIVTSGWYAANIGGRHLPVDEAIARGPASRFAARFRLARGALIFLAARRGLGAALRRREPGTLTALCLCALVRDRRIVILELIPDRPARAAWRRMLKRAWFRLVERPAVRRGMRAGQVLSEAEKAPLAALYGLGPDRLVHVPWALCRTGEAPIVPASERRGVLASGRAACDWETLFAAARGREWELTVVCGAADRARVEALNADRRVEVRSEISRDRHDALMRGAAVYAIPLVDDGLSSGQVRLMTATELGAPVVSSGVATLREYVVDGETALTVPPGDPAALREAVESLLADPDRRDELARAALARGRARTYADYFGEVGAMVERALRPPAGA